MSAFFGWIFWCVFVAGVYVGIRGYWDPDWFNKQAGNKTKKVPPSEIRSGSLMVIAPAFLAFWGMTKYPGALSMLVAVPLACLALVKWQEYRHRRDHQPPPPVRYAPVKVSSGTATPVESGLQDGYQSSLDSMKTVSFKYRDREGDYSSRTVTVKAVDDAYLEGFCHLRQDSRTFKFERIRGDITIVQSGKRMRLREWAQEMRRHVSHSVKNGADYRWSPRSESAHREWQTAVYFIGFRESRRSELEMIAEAAGLQVRQGFSTTLDMVVTGSLAGAGQMDKAYALGVEVLTEDEFRARY